MSYHCIPARMANSKNQTKPKQNKTKQKTIQRAGEDEEQLRSLTYCLPEWPVWKTVGSVL